MISGLPRQVHQYTKYANRIRKKPRILSRHQADIAKRLVC